MNKYISRPKVTVLLPAYNAEKYIKEAIESILNQTYQDFELLIINDGSNDNTGQIINSFHDQRIILVNNKRNLKLVKTLNLGLSLARGRYIVRMDADDISLPERISVQVNYMDNNPEIGISGTQIIPFGRVNRANFKRFTKSGDLKANLLFMASIAHPSVIMRKAMLDKYDLMYDENFPHGEDRELWSRAILKFPITNINKALVKYRVHAESISAVYSEIQFKTRKNISKQLLKYIGLDPTDEELSFHHMLKFKRGANTSEYCKAIENWFVKLLHQNRTVNYCPEKTLKRIIAGRWYLICRVNNLGIKKFISSPLANILDYKSFLNLLKIIAK